MKISSHLLFWLTIWGMMFLASPLVLSQDGQIARIKDEISSIKLAFGTAKADEIVSDSSGIYRRLFIDTKVLTEENKLYTKSDDREGTVGGFTAAPARSMSNLTNGYLRALSVNVYGLFIRWNIFLHWSIFILPFIMAAFVDGFVTRKIKFAQFGFISPMAYSFSMHIILFLTFIPLLYLVMPLPITPYFMPTWAMIMAFPINMLVSNTQRLFNG